MNERTPIVLAFGVLFAAVCLGQAVEPRRAPIGGTMNDPATTLRVPINALVVFADRAIPREEVQNIANKVQGSLELLTRQTQNRAMLQQMSDASSLFERRLGQYLQSVSPGQRVVVTVTTFPGPAGSPGSGLRPNCKDWSCPWRCESVTCPAGSNLLSCCAECNDTRACCTYSCVKQRSGQPFFGRSMPQGPGRAVELLVLVVNGETHGAEAAALEEAGIQMLENQPFPMGNTVSVRLINLWGR